MPTSFMTALEEIKRNTNTVSVFLLNILVWVICCFTKYTKIYGPKTKHSQKALQDIPKTVTKNLNN